MHELEIRKNTAQQIMNVEYLPDIPEEKLKLASCQKYPIGNLTALGVSFKPLASAIQTLAGKSNLGMSGIYQVNTKGLQMMQFKQGTGFLGSLATETGGVGGGQAILKPLPCDPTMLFMAATLMCIEKKLDDIRELQEEMLDFLKSKEKAKLRGDANVLIDIYKNYKFNWNNEKYKTNKHILVQDIKKESEQSIQLFRSQIQKKLTNKGFIHGDKEVKTKLQKLQDEFKDYQLALYLFSFSGYMEVMLLENFDRQYLESVIYSIEDYAFQFRELYTICYNQIEMMSKTSIESFLVKGLAGISKGAGDAIAKIPVVSKGPVDEALIAAGNKIGKFNDRKTEKNMDWLINVSENCTRQFAENIRLVDKIYNEPMEILFDNRNIYLLEATQK